MQGVCKNVFLSSILFYSVVRSLYLEETYNACRPVLLGMEIVIIIWMPASSLLREEKHNKARRRIKAISWLVFLLDEYLDSQYHDGCFKFGPLIHLIC